MSNRKGASQFRPFLFLTSLPKPCFIFLAGTVCRRFVDVPYLAAFEHARVDDVGAHESRLHSFDLLCQELVGQRLVKAHSRKLTGTVILSNQSQN